MSEALGRPIQETADQLQAKAQQAFAMVIRELGATTGKEPKYFKYGVNRIYVRVEAGFGDAFNMAAEVEVEGLESP
jgi:hypothetical protein